MPRPRILSPAQEKKLRAHIHIGADLRSLQAYAEKLKIKASRALLGQLFKSERDLMATEITRERSANPPSLDGDDLPIWAEEIKRELASLRGRLDVLMTMPKVKLSDAATGAVYIAQTMMGDPTLDPNVKAKIMAQLPDLIESASKALESERGGGDDELGV